MTKFLMQWPLLLMFPLVAFGQHPSTENLVAVVDGHAITEQDLAEVLGQQLMQLRNQEYEAKSRALESVIRHKIVEIEARKRNISPEKLIEQEVDSKVPEPTDGEVEAYFFGQNRAGIQLADVKDQYRSTLKQLKLVRARQAFADSLRAKTEVAVLLRPPAIDVAFDPARVKGDPKAPVTIVEFSDYECPYCKKTEAVLTNLLEKYKGRIKLAYLDFPLREIHPHAELAAQASRCAEEQDKFWEFHDSLFADPTKLAETDLLTRARTLGLREEAFRGCLASRKFKDSVDGDREAGVKAGVGGTPGFFINGVFLSGAQSQPEFEKVIETQLALLGRRPAP